MTVATRYDRLTGNFFQTGRRGAGDLLLVVSV